VYRIQHALDMSSRDKHVRSVAPCSAAGGGQDARASGCGEFVGSGVVQSSAAETTTTRDDERCRSADRAPSVVFNLLSNHVPCRVAAGDVPHWASSLPLYPDVTECSGLITLTQITCRCCCCCCLPIPHHPACHSTLRQNMLMLQSMQFSLRILSSTLTT